LPLLAKTVSGSVLITQSPLIAPLHRLARSCWSTPRMFTQKSAPVAQPTPGAAPPPAVSVTNPIAPKPPFPIKRAMIVLGGLALGGLVIIGARLANDRKDVQMCAGSDVVDACRRACAKGDGPACTKAATAGIASRDAAEAQRSAKALEGACESGDAESCAVLGRARAFPMSAGIERNQERAVALLEKACEKGRGCAMLGSLKMLGWKGIAKDAAHYFDAACKDAPTAGLPLSERPKGWSKRRCRAVRPT